MASVLGVDGCRGGWLGALVENGRLRWLSLPDAAAVIAVDADVIGVDIPIGLPPSGRRACDLAAKTLLGKAHPRVFLTPPRPVLAARSWAEASALHRELVDGKSLSIQTWHLLGKVADVDAVAGDPRLVEVHPELSFLAITGAVLPSKKTPTGRAARLAALRKWLPGLRPGNVPAGDDAPDAVAAAWSAARWLGGEATALPGHPAYDELGRPMRIVS